jgi:sulfhydrogenase subunit beta (sulfur reductase)
MSPRDAGPAEVTLAKVGAKGTIDPSQWPAPVLPSTLVGGADGVVVDVGGLDEIISCLRTRGYRTIGPIVRDGAIQLGEFVSADELPKGWHDIQSPGSYRLEHTGDDALFAWAVGPHSIKSEVFPPRAVVWRAHPHDEAVHALTVEEARDETEPIAVFGARPCELAALDVLDRVLGNASAPDPVYEHRREACFVVVVECAAPGGTCFCASMGTGPGAERGFDLALTELLDDDGHRFVVRVGSERGAQILDTVLATVEHEPAGERERSARTTLLDRATGRMGRRLDTEDLPALLARNLEHPRWVDVASRCLACGNCTLVCPTCFCSSVEDTSDLDGTLTRTRTWSSCFDLAHSFIHGGPVRSSTQSRYRQWMTHKLSTWWDHFGTSGCVGCGRCITWCPVGIDITEEAGAIRATDGGTTGTGAGMVETPHQPVSRARFATRGGADA